MRNNSGSSMEIVSRYKSRVPVPVLDIAHEMGIKVYKSKGWPDYISGLIRMDSRARRK